jgi:hypothetical protein
METTVIDKQNNLLIKHSAVARVAREAIEMTKSERFRCHDNPEYVDLQEIMRNVARRAVTQEAINQNDDLLDAVSAILWISVEDVQQNFKKQNKKPRSQK